MLGTEQSPSKLLTSSELPSVFLPDQAEIDEFEQQLIQVLASENPFVQDLTDELHAKSDIYAFYKGAAEAHERKQYVFGVLTTLFILLSLASAIHLDREDGFLNGEWVFLSSLIITMYSGAQTLINHLQWHSFQAWKLGTGQTIGELARQLRLDQAEGYSEERLATAMGNAGTGAEMHEERYHRGQNS